MSRGSKPGERRGGRQKGTPNRATAAKAAAVAASGLTPLDFMLSVMREEANDLDVRLEAAKSAAPFVHPKLAQIEHSTDPANPLEINFKSDRDFARRVAFFLSKGMREKP